MQLIKSEAWWVTSLYCPLWSQPVSSLCLHAFGLWVFVQVFLHVWILFWHEAEHCLHAETPTPYSHMHVHLHTEPQVIFILAHGRWRAGTTIKCGFTSCFHRQAANYLQVPVAVRSELPQTGSINLTSLGPLVHPLLFSLASASPRNQNLRQIEASLVPISGLISARCLRRWLDLIMLEEPFSLRRKFTIFKRNNRVAVES